MRSWLQQTRHPHLGISEQNLVLVAFLYLRRLKPHTITSDNIVNLTLIALVIATKYGSDYIYHDSYYARVSHIPLPTLSHLQWVFLSEIDYRLFVSPEDLKEAQNLLRESALGKIGI